VKKSDFRFELPPELIAQRPLTQRTDSRLLCLDRGTGRLADRHFRELPDLIRPDDLLVFNNTRVLPARVFGKKETGGRLELLVERLLGGRDFLAQCRVSKPPKPGSRIRLDGDIYATILGRRGEFYELRLETDDPVPAVLERIGHVPLPPYIDRHDESADRERYQTVFARTPGAVAAPTAGLHFDEAILGQLDGLGVERVEVTLHVGAGTFAPMRTDEIASHVMHSEWLSVSSATANRVRAARAAGQRIVAVGTTVVRALETAAGQGTIEPYEGETTIFIYPGYRFQAVDGLITNFHLPESTLLMLVCAFAGTDSILAAYRHAVNERYRFFSYGDAMLILPEK